MTLFIYCYCLPWALSTSLGSVLPLYMDIWFVFSFPDSVSQTIYLISFHSLKLTTPIPTASSDSHVPQEESSSSCFLGEEKLNSSILTVLFITLFGRILNRRDAFNNLFIFILHEPCKHLYMPESLYI